MVDIQTFLGAFLNMSLMSACFSNKAFFSSEKQNFQPLNCSPQVPSH
jgi:hypothetical protein